MTPTVSWTSTLTDNVDLAPSDQKRSDWVNEISPGLQFAGASAHAKVDGSIVLPVLLYARTSENNYVQPQVNITGSVEAIEHFFFIDASVHVSQQYITPFGATPNNLANATDNRYTAQDYTISPYIRGRTKNVIEYEVRDTNTWSLANVHSADSANGYSNELAAHVRRDARPTGWSVEYDRTEVKFTDRQSENTEIARARVIYWPDPTLQLSLIGGYEDNQFTITRERGPVYGAGVSWRPGERTALDATIEHRFFGTGYHFTFNHRMPLSVFEVRASRDTTSYPQQLADLPAGSNVSQLLNSVFSSRVPDPVQRQALVDQVIRNRGLPGQLSSPVVLFSQQITVVESFAASYGILGARNSILFTAYRSKDTPVEDLDSALPPQFLQDLNQDSTQVGANVAFSHSLTPTVGLGVDAYWYRTTSNEGGETTRQYGADARISRALSVLTTLFGGVRVQSLSSNISPGYREFAVFVGMTHSFH